MRSENHSWGSRSAGFLEGLEQLAFSTTIYPQSIEKRLPLVTLLGSCLVISHIKRAIVKGHRAPADLDEHFAHGMVFLVAYTLPVVGFGIEIYIRRQGDRRKACAEGGDRYGWRR